MQDKAYINKPAYVSLWVNLLLLANHKDKEVIWNGSILTIKRGQFITGRKELSKLTGIPETTIERILKVFKNGHQIEQQTCNKYRLITILNWDKYQVADNKRTTNGQQTDTNKNERMKRSISEPNGSAGNDLKNKKKDMPWNTRSDDYEEGIIDLDGDGTIVEEKKLQTRKYPNAPKVRKIFQEVLGRTDANWNINKTQLLACENLYTERGEKKIRNALQWYKDHKDLKFCPKVDSPYDLDAKYVKLSQFKTEYEN